MKPASQTHMIETHQRTKRHIRHLPYGVFLADRTGLVIEANETLLQATGFARSELIGTSFGRILPSAGSLDQLYEEFRSREEEEDPVVELEWVNCHGERAMTPVMIAPLPDGETGWAVHLLRVTGKVCVELLQRMTRLLLAEANLGVILLDRGGRVADINQLASKLLGMDRMEVINRHVDGIFAGIPDDRRLVSREVLEGVKVQNKAISWTLDNQRYELLLDGHPLYEENGRMIGSCVLLKDVTNLRSFDQKIERHDRLAMIGQIAAGTAHEIRNPLTSIKGFLQIFHQLFTEKGMERERSYTEVMLTEINRINSLVSEFLLLSKPKDMQYQLVDLNTVMEEILPIVESQALLQGVEVRYLSGGQLPMVVADAELLKQVFLNICKNGMEAMGDSGMLTLSHHSESELDMISIDIHDTGPGIPIYVIDKIFDPFFTTKEEGTGLGLAVCQKIIHDLGGQIRVSSKGYGTTFHILLPYL